MEIYSFLAVNKDLLKVFYGLIITGICLIIVLKTDKLFRISSYQGIRYFRNTFFFYGLAFFVRALLGASFFLSYDDVQYYYTLNLAFEFFLVIASFFLAYSLVWKKFESPLDRFSSSLMQAKFGVFYGMAFIVVLLDSIWRTHYFLLFSQSIIFAFITLMSLKKVMESNKKHIFPKFYFIAMFMYFTAWILNFVAFLLLGWSQDVIINVHLINITIFLLFLFGVIGQTKIKR